MALYAVSHRSRLPAPPSPFRAGRVVPLLLVALVVGATLAAVRALPAGFAALPDGRSFAVAGAAERNAGAGQIWARPGAENPAAPPPVSAQEQRGCGLSAELVPACGVLTGVAPGAFTSGSKRRALADFERSTGAPTDIVHVYHSAGELFPTATDIALSRQGGRRRLLMVNYKPEGGHTWAQVARGAMDHQLDREARYLKARYTEPFFFTVHHEPEDDVRPTPGSGFTARDYAAMYRHVIERLRRDGVTDLVTVLDLVGSPNWGVRSWFTQLYPGDDVVDWLAWDPYACIDASLPCGDFAGMVDRTASPAWPGFYAWATRAHPGKPLMLAEWGVYRNGGTARQAAFVASVDRELPRFPALKALLYFDTPRDARGSTRIAGGSAAQAAFAKLLEDHDLR